MADWIVKASTGKSKDGKDFTQIVGRAFNNKAGGINIMLNLMPLPQDGTVKLTLWPDDGEKRGGGGGGGARQQSQQSGGPGAADFDDVPFSPVGDVG